MPWHVRRQCPMSVRFASLSRLSKLDFAAIVLSVLSLACASAPADYVSGHSSTLTGAACNGLIAAIGDAASDVTCFESTDLTTENPATIPPDNSIPGLPPGL